MKSCWLTYEGTRILYGDFRSLGPGDMDLLDAELKAVEPMIRLEPRGSVLMVCDVRDSVATTEAMALWKGFATRVAPHVHKMAGLGIGGFKKVLFDALVHLSGIHAVAFEDMERAQDWLVK